jgi:hypothetical protein
MHRVTITGQYEYFSLPLIAPQALNHRKMKPLRYFLIAIFPSLLINSLPVEGQVVQGKPDSFINPDHDVNSLGQLDSIVQYAYATPWDSSRLHRWDYEYPPGEGMIISYMSNWAPDTREYRMYHRYENAYNSNGQQTLEAHYFYNWQLGRWRGCSSEGCGKKEWHFDDNGNQTFRAQYYWNQNNKTWDISNKTENQFDAYSNQTRTAYFAVDQSTGALIGNSKSEYSYYPDQKLWGEVYYNWNYGFNDWRAWTKIINEYPDDTTTMQTYYDWMYPELEWVESSKGRILKVRDSINNVEEETIYDWDETVPAWIPYTRVENYMNESGETVLYYKYYWNLNDKVWRNNNKKVREYDENGNLIMSVDYMWSAADSLWVGATNFFIGPGKYSYEYNQEGKLKLFTHYDWDRNNNDWIGAEDSQIELKYNGNGQVTEEIRYDWSPESAQWEPSNRLVIGYMPTGEVIAESQYAWDEDLDEWELIMRYFFYHSISTSVRQLELSGVNIYPNPNNGILHIDGLNETARIQFYNIQGQVVMDVFTDSYRIDLSDIPGGLYIVKIQDGDRIHIQKLVRE